MEQTEPASQENRDKNIYVNSANYLHRIITELNGLNVPTLKSLYGTKLKAIELQKKIQVQPEKKSFYCRKCLITFKPTDLNGHCKLKSKKYSKFAKNIISKLRRGRPLTSYQRKSYKMLRWKFFNNLNTNQRWNEMVITCKFCKKVNKLPFLNPIKKKVVITNPQKKKKKSQKKDMFCGLNREAVLSSTFTPSTSDAKKDQKKRPSPPPTPIYTNTGRGFETTSFISLETKKSIKIKSKKNITELQRPVLSEKAMKQKKKNLQKLGGFLKNSQNNQKKASGLSDFLKSCEVIANSKK